MIDPAPAPSGILSYKNARWGVLAVFLVMVVVFTLPPRVSSTLRESTSNTVTEDVMRFHDAALVNYQQDIYTWMLKSSDLSEALKRKNFAHLIEVPRVHEKDLTFADFYKNYVLASKPVLITNLSSFSREWSMDYIKEMCGETRVTPLVPTEEEGEQWANLREQNETTLTEFLDTFVDYPPPRPYLHDMSLVENCPAILNDYTVPRYYVQNYLVDAKQVDRETGEVERPFETAWPSLFVGSTDTGSGLHIDNSDTHFVMHMISGVKDFRFIPPEDRILAYEDRTETDVTFEANLFFPDFERHPILALATVYHATLRDGDFLFFPGGSAHQTINRGPTMAISANFVDASNYERVTTVFDEQQRYSLADNIRERVATGEFRTKMTAHDTPWPKLFPHLAEP